MQPDMSIRRAASAQINKTWHFIPGAYKDSLMDPKWESSDFLTCSAIQHL